MCTSCVYIFLGIFDPSAVGHPNGILLALAANHEKDGSVAVALEEELVVDPVALLPCGRVGLVEVIQALRVPLLGYVRVAHDTEQLVHVTILEQASTYELGQAVRTAGTRKRHH